ncbi:Hsp70 family protein [Methylobacterium indicum]|uniref:Molecular chaperone HscC n=1 Tax=Methylobacterium indicum TaxID=1775910 RepID=A0A8H8WZ06_9HYPH|nr:molecular chaperone HscC [Methylobacterium indicum]BCM86989.1 molecular chaperone HscC [Methylobacterium indicum]
MIVGIDLGTTNSLVGVWTEGEARLIPNVYGEVLTPSAVCLDRDGSVAVGRPALDRVVAQPGLAAAAFKRFMGSRHEVRLGSRSFRPEELSAFILRQLKSDAEAALGREVTEAVITVPAFFNDVQRRAVRAAGQLADLTVERILNEPTAAALAYGLQARHAEGGKILVFDLGGGTFDVSVLEMFDGVMEVRATAGDAFLGGEDFVDAIVAWFEATTGLTGADPGVKARLRRQAELAKRALDREPEVEIRVEGGDGHPGGRAHRAVLTAERFAELAEPLLARLRRPVERAMSDARLDLSDLSDVVLAGGATRAPIVRRLAARLFGRLPLSSLDPDEVVARGAAVQAGLKAGDAALEETVLTDVAPFTLGVEVSEPDASGRLRPGIYMPVIERNTLIPVSRTKTVHPCADDQRQVTCAVFQGESRLTKDNIPLGEFTLTLQPRPIDRQALELRFTYDVNGVLEVSATSTVDGRSERLVIRNSPTPLDPAEIEVRLAALADLKIAPRDTEAYRALLARGERLFAEALGAPREAVGRAIAAFERALEAGEAEAITRAAEELRAVIRALGAVP